MNQSQSKWAWSVGVYHTLLRSLKRNGFVVSWKRHEFVRKPFNLPVSSLWPWPSSPFCQSISFTCLSISHHVYQSIISSPCTIQVQDQFMCPSVSAITLPEGLATANANNPARSWKVSKMQKEGGVTASVDEYRMCHHHHKYSHQGASWKHIQKKKHLFPSLKYCIVLY